MRKASLLFLMLLALAVFTIAQTSTAPADQSSPTSSNPNSPASPNPSNPQSSMPPDVNQIGSPSSTQSGAGPSSQTTTSSTSQAQTNASSSQNTQSDQPVLSGSRDQSATTATVAADVPAGAELKATLDTPLSTKTSKVGDTFTATVADPVRSSSGQVVIPAGSKIQGEVTEAEQGKTVAVLRGKGKLNMHFRDIQLPDGSSVPLSATLVSVNSTKGSSKASSEGEVQSGGTGKRAAKDIGIGAGIGTVAGLIFGSALKGLAIGALAGGGYVLATNGKDVELPAKTGMVLRLDHNLSVATSSSAH